MASAMMERRRLMKLVVGQPFDSNASRPGKPVWAVKPNRKEPETAWGLTWYSVLLSGQAYWLADDGEGGVYMCAGGYRKVGPNEWGPPIFPVDNQGRRYE